MRKSMAIATAATALVGSLGAFGAQVVAAPRDGASNMTQVSPRAAGCVSVVRWYNERFNRMVEVKNTCARKACFSVTVAASRDPEFAIGANKKQSFRYGGIAWTKGSGIKNIGC
ncbi:hypothetical protein [Streptomyces sp. NPDC001970]